MVHLDSTSIINQEELDLAYANFAQASMPIVRGILLTQSNPETQQQLHKRTAVRFQMNSLEIYLLLDGSCPDFGAGNCITVFAKFRLDLDDEDPDKTGEDYTRETQKLIENLRDALAEVNEFHPLEIVDASNPAKGTRPPTSPPGLSEAPSLAPTPEPRRPSGPTSSGNQNGAINLASGMLILTLAVGVGMYLCGGKGLRVLTMRRKRKTNDSNEGADGEDTDGENKKIRCTVIDFSTTCITLYATLSHLIINPYVIPGGFFHNCKNTLKYNQ